LPGAQASVDILGSIAAAVCAANRAAEEEAAAVGELVQGEGTAGTPPARCPAQPLMLVARLCHARAALPHEHAWVGTRVCVPSLAP